jgi:hypothetical protein
MLTQAESPALDSRPIFVFAVEDDELEDNAMRLQLLFRGFEDLERYSVAVYRL